MVSRKDAMKQFEENTGGNRGAGFFDFVDVAVLGELGFQEYKSTFGDNFIDILDPNKGEGFFWKEVFIHSNVGKERRTFVCPNKMFNEPCPMCEEIQRIYDRGEKNEGTKKLLSKLYAKPRYLLFVIDTSSEDSIASGVKWYDAPPIVISSITAACKNKRTGEHTDPTHPTNGKGISFEKVKTGSENYDVKYQGFALETRVPIQDSWKDLPSFDEFLLHSTYKEIDTHYSGVLATTPVEEKVAAPVEPVQTEAGTSRRTRSVSATPVEEKTEAPVEAKKEEQLVTEEQPVAEEKPMSTKERLELIRKRAAEKREAGN